MTRTSLLQAGIAVVVLLGSTACGGRDPAADGDTLRVFAAASLRSPFEALGREFEADHPGVDVQLNFAGSSDLATQIIAGAPVDVFAAADESTMQKVAAEDLLSSEPRIFATNMLTIAVPAGNPEGIDSLDSLADPELSVVLCAPQVPCGAAAEKLQRAAGVDIAADSEEASVTDVLGKVTSGQADAGLVYVTDLSASRGVDGIELESADEAVNAYPIAATASARATADDFLALVTGPRGREILSAGGFGIPSP